MIFSFIFSNKFKKSCSKILTKKQSVRKFKNKKYNPNVNWLNPLNEEWLDSIGCNKKFIRPHFKFLLFNPIINVGVS